MTTKNATEFRELSQYIMTDTYFQKLPFLEALSKAKLFLINKLRSDSDLKYLYNGHLIGKRQAPKKFMVKKIQVGNQDNKINEFVAVVHSFAFKKKIKMVIVHYLSENGEKIKQESLIILMYYKCGFQIEILF